MESGKYRIKKVERYNGEIHYELEARRVGPLGSEYWQMISLNSSYEEIKILKNNLEGRQIKSETIVE